MSKCGKRGGLVYMTAIITGVLGAPVSAFALDSYRYLHVKLDTVWFFFIFLFFLVFAPMIIMAVLYWWRAMKKPDDDQAREN